MKTPARLQVLLDEGLIDSVLRQLTPRPAAALASFANLLDELRSASLHQNAADLVELILARTGYAAQIISSTPDASLRERRLGNLKELADWFRAMQKGNSAGDLAAQRIGHEEPPLRLRGHLHPGPARVLLEGAAGLEVERRRHAHTAVAARQFRLRVFLRSRQAGAGRCALRRRRR